MSLIADAFSDWRECREAYDDHLRLQYVQAEEATNGALLNARGRTKDVDPMSLFMGPEVRAMAYASEELREWWEKHPRVTFEQFERAWARDRAESMQVAS